MFVHTRTVRLRETDATGVLYFSEQLKLALEAFEAYLGERGWTLQHMIEGQEFLLPIVHVEADYSSPLRAGDPLRMELSLQKMGTSSFTLRTHLFCGERAAGQVTIVHVATSPRTGKSIPIPPLILEALQGL